MFAFAVAPSAYALSWLMLGSNVFAPPQVVIEVDDDEPSTPPSPVNPATPSPAASAPTVGNPQPSGPTSESAAGSSSVVSPAAAPAAASRDVASSDPRINAEQWQALQQRVAALEASLKAAQAAATAAKVPAKPPIDREQRSNDVAADLPAAFDRPIADLVRKGITIGGYLQVQYDHSQLSEDQLAPGNHPLNRDRFMVRRGRIRFSGSWQWFAAQLELDGSTTNGPYFGIRQANLSVLWRNAKQPTLPYLQVTAGLTESAFGHELRVGQRDLPFFERSRGSLAFFPGPVDVGVRARGALGLLRYDIAVLNGTPLDDRAGGRATFEPTAAPDVMGRIGLAAKHETWSLGGGLSALTGTGFHPGKDASKNHLDWVDLNENSALDTGEITVIPGTAATPSQKFHRWAVNADFEAALHTRLGWSQLMLEGTLASNLDRDFFVADPILLGSDLRETNVVASVVQDLSRWAFIGFRFDRYDPNSDWLDNRRGSLVPRKAAVATYSPLLGARLPRGHFNGFAGRLVFQYDAITDALGRDARGVPRDAKNNTWSVRVQGEF